MKIKQVKMRLNLDPKRDWLETTVAINYDPTDKRSETYRRPIPEKRFYVNLPPSVADVLGYTTSRGNTQDEALATFKADLEKFKNLETEHNRVIIYRISVTPDPTSKYSPGTGYGVNVVAHCFEETVAIDGAGARRYSYEKAESSLDFPGSQYIQANHTGGEREDKQVPWTEQNEAFFLWVGDRLAELVDRLRDIQAPDKLIEQINEGRLLPLGQTSV